MADENRNARHAFAAAAGGVLEEQLAGAVLAVGAEGEVVGGVGGGGGCEEGVGEGRGVLVVCWRRGLAGCLFVD